MKQWVIAGTLVGSLALGGAAIAQQPSPSAQKPAPSAGTQADKPATGQKPTAKRPGAGDTAQGETRTPKQQPTTAPAADLAATATTLGSVRIPREVKADGKSLPAGTYQVRLTADEAKPDAVGTSGSLERWVEFVQKGSVKGREVVSIVPQDEIKMVEKDTPPAPNASKVQMLKGNDYLRVWINKGGNHYLIHLVAA